MYRLTLKKIVELEGYRDYLPGPSLFIFVDNEGHKYTWKTSSAPCYTDATPGPKEGDTLTCDASVKETTTYKGELQTVLTRCRNFSFVSNECEERAKQKHAARQQQLDSVHEGDKIVEMPYRQFKAHYADCETVIDSFRYRVAAYDKEEAVISVIIRKGRLKASGVRGEQYALFTFYNNATAEKKVLKAISETTARRRLPEGEWELVKESCKHKGGFYI